MRTRLVPVAVLAALALSACSGGGARDAGATLPPVSVATTPPAAPSSTPSAPADTAPASVEGAVAFTRFFYSVVVRAYREKSPQLLEDLVTADCAGCQGLVASVSRIRDERATAEYEISVKDVAASGAVGPNGTVAVLAIVNVGAFVKRDATGVVVASQAPSPGTVQDLQLLRVSGKWRVNSLVTRK